MEEEKIVSESNELLEQEKKVNEENEAEMILGHNLRFYAQGCEVPPDALKPIKAGRLRGMSDVNPMWRMKRMTEIFGPCGFGWKYEIVRQWTEEYILSSTLSTLPDIPFRDEVVENGKIIRPAIPPTTGVETRNQQREVKCFCNINLYVRDPYTKEWSEPIPGCGGSAIVSIEKNGPYVNDEGYKMALTDALSIAMKALGIGGNIWYGPNAKGHNESKYEQYATAESTQTLLEQALKELDGVRSDAEFMACWNKWYAVAPVLCQNGTEFYKKACEKRQSINTPLQ